MQQLQKLQPLVINSLRELPDEAEYEREMLERQGIQAVLLVPMVEQEILRGYVAFDSVRAERIWKRELIVLLQMFSHFVLRAITQLHFARALQDSEAKHRQLFEQANDAILIIRDDVILECNAVAVTMFRAESREAILGSNPWTLPPKCSQVDAPLGP